MAGKIYYPNMQTQVTVVDGKEILLDGEGYLLDLEEWTKNFVYVRADAEGLDLTDEHWDVINYIRTYYEKNNVQAPVRDMIKHFRDSWGKEKANTRYLHAIFPLGGPQKQGNRLAGVRKPKGEH